MSRRNRLAEGDWEQYWEEQAIEDWEEQLSAEHEFQDEFEEDWEAQDGQIFRCPRCGTKRLVDAESYSFFKTSDACEDCVWETYDRSDEEPEDLSD